MTSGVELAVPSSAISGVSMGGQAPISGAVIAIYAMGTTGYGSTSTLEATTTTTGNGSFSFPAGSYTCPQADTPLYLLSSGGDTGSGVNSNAVNAVSLGPCSGASNESVVVNEVTTAAMAVAMAYYFNEINSGYTMGSDSFGGPSSTSHGTTTYSTGLLRATNLTLPYIENLNLGTATCGVNSTPPAVIECAKIYTIANILAACVNTTGETSHSESKTICGNLFGYTKNGLSSRPYDTLQAAVEIALNPTVQVKNLYNLIPPVGFAFGGYNTTQPKDFSVGASYTSSAASLAVPSDAITTMDIDGNGNIWYASNGAGQTGVGAFVPPTEWAGPYNGTSMVDPTQIAIDNANTVWVNDAGSAVVSAYSATTPGTTYVPHTLPGTVSTALTINDDNSVAVGVLNAGVPELASVNTARSSYALLPNSTLTYPAVSLAGDSVGGDAIDATTLPAEGLLASYYGPSTSNTVVNLAADTGLAGRVIFTGNDFVALNDGYKKPTDDLCLYSLQSCYELQPQGAGPTDMVIDGQGTIWTTAPGKYGVYQIPINNTSATQSAVYLDTSKTPSRVLTNQLVHGPDDGGTIITPAAIAIDNSGNIWVANAGCTTTGCTPTNFVLSEIVGAAAPTITPVSLGITQATVTTGTEPNY
jgi:hypothetical protein